MAGTLKEQLLMTVGSIKEGCNWLGLNVSLLLCCHSSPSSLGQTCLTTSMISLWIHLFLHLLCLLLLFDFLLPAEPLAVINVGTNGGWC